MFSVHPLASAPQVSAFGRLKVYAKVRRAAHHVDKGRLSWVVGEVVQASDLVV